MLVNTREVKGIKCALRTLSSKLQKAVWDFKKSTFILFGKFFNCIC